MAEQVKSKQRVADHGEVFTAEREVNAMLDLVKQETERIDSRFLEPACGTGNFLVEILRRKLAAVKNKYKRNPMDYERNSILALMSMYGVDLLLDNVIECRNRLYDIWNSEYTANCKNEASDVCRETAKYVLEKNILCGDALTLKQNNGEPITFAEWSFVMGNMVKRRDFCLDVLLKEQEKKEYVSDQFSLFDDDVYEAEKCMIDPETNEYIPKPIKEYPLTPYRRVQENG